MEIRECSWSWRTPLARRSETTRIILHHAAAASCTAEDVHRWHLANGWSGIGYHYFVSKDGEITRGRPLWAVGAHAEGSNRVSVGICFEGNFQLEEEMPAAQRQAGRALVAALRERYPAALVFKGRQVIFQPPAFFITADSQICGVPGIFQSFRKPLRIVEQNQSAVRIILQYPEFQLEFFQNLVLIKTDFSF